MWPNLQFRADLVTFTEEILNGKLQFLWSACFPSIFLLLAPFILMLKQNLHKHMLQISTESFYIPIKISTTI